MLVHQLKAKRILLSFFVITAVLIIGCASTGTNKVTLDDTKTPDSFSAGDGIRIMAYPDSNFLNGTYPIDINGNVFLPIVGKVNALAMTPEQLTAFLQQSYQAYLRYPEIQVEPMLRVSMLGGFFRPGMYYVNPNRSIWDLVYMAGGTNHEKGLKELRWERNRKMINKNLIPYLESGESLRRIGFRSGDQIWTPTVPMSFWNLAVRSILLETILPLTTLILSIYLATDDSN